MGVLSAIGYGALNAVPSVIGGLFGARNQDKANQTNVTLQRETNELNRYLAEHQFSLAAQDMERQKPENPSARTDETGGLHGHETQRYLAGP